MNVAPRVTQCFRLLAASTVVIAALLFGVGGLGAKADDTTVQSLLKQGYTVVGVIHSHAGGGVFLVKADSLMFCHVAETPTSPTVATQYCKPVK